MEHRAIEADGPIAIVGMACRYPGAADPRELWENVLAKRQQFRRIPDDRLPASDYVAADGKAADRTHTPWAAVLDGFVFDWVGRRIPQSTFEATDTAHWLALEVALDALHDAGLTPGSLPAERTGVVVGNTLTGDRSRAQALRLRWPFVERVLRTAGAAEGLSRAVVDGLAASMETAYKSVFEPVSEDTLAGGLSNTIAGRICNFLDVHGGGYTVDGACASSLLAVAAAAEHLRDGALDLALAGGVDLSLDPFELVGFAKMGALTTSAMRVFDRRADGFIAGEGCGFVVLKRLGDAARDGDHVYAVLCGWGVSSDGRGGITAPSAAGQARAIGRAYERCRFAPRDLAFVEAHGTGTAVGDPTEIAGIALALGPVAEEPVRRYGVTALKSILGHTKAAAGVGGLISAVVAVNRRVIPPVAGCRDPHPAFDARPRVLYPVRRGVVRDRGETLRAGVSAAGFGGINCHVTVESAGPPADRLQPALSERTLLASAQSTELFVVAAPSRDELRRRLVEVRSLAQGMSRAELPDLAASLAQAVAAGDPARGAVLASAPEELLARLEELERLAHGSAAPRGRVAEARRQRVWIGGDVAGIRLGFLFPGQGSQMLDMAGQLVERHPWARARMQEAAAWLDEEYALDLERRMFPPLDRAVDREQIGLWLGELTRTEVAQPAVALASLLWLDKLTRLGLRPAVVAGHSLGELVAFHRAGAYDGRSLLRLAALRGRAMASGSGPPGAMLALACGRDVAASLALPSRGRAVVACVNGPSETVLSGEASAIGEIEAAARRAGVPARRLNVSHAFHSGLVAGAARALRERAPIPDRAVEMSVRLRTSIDGSEVEAGCDLREHFDRQLVSPVDFVALVRRMGDECDLLLEVGPGSVLSTLAGEILGPEGPPCLPVESRPGRDDDLQRILACCFVRGGDVDWQAVFEDRLLRPFRPARERRFLVNPCERPLVTAPRAAAGATAPIPAAPIPDAAFPLLIELIAARTGFPPDTLTAELRLLDDLNLDSIKASEIVATTAERLGIAGRLDPAEFAGGSLGEIAAVLERIASRTRPREATGDSRESVGPVATSAVGWVRDFAVVLEEEAVVAGPDRQPVDEVLIVREPGEHEYAEALSRRLAATAARVLDCTWADLQDRAGRPGRRLSVAILPRADRADPGAADARLRSAIERLHRFAASAARAAESGPLTLALVQRAGTFAYESCCTRAFASSLHLELPEAKIRVVDFADGIDPAALADAVLRETATDAAFGAAEFDARMVRRVPRPRLLDRSAYSRRPFTLGPGDVILVTGGAQGVTAECALGLAHRTGASMVLVGRTPHPEDPAATRDSAAIARTLERYRELGMAASYQACDVADAASVATLIARVEAELGAVTGVIHGAGLNRPRPVASVSAGEAYDEIAPKILGAVNLCSSLGHRPLKFVAGITSIIGITGMPGNAWYGFSNEAADLVLGAFASDHPATSVLACAFSVWGDTGMARRMGVVGRIAASGVAPIRTLDGVEHFCRLVEHDPGHRQVVVASRVSGLDTWRPRRPPPPGAAGFLEEIVTFCPGVEVIARARLTLDAHPYLRDHEWRGSHLFPVVLGLEAMAQAVAWVAGLERLRQVEIEEIVVGRPVVVPPHGDTTIEIRAAALEEPGPGGVLRVRAGIATSRTGFGVEHFSARFVLGGGAVGSDEVGSIPADVLDLEPQELYPWLLFQGPSFRRLSRIRSLDSRSCVFDAERRTDGRSVLGDPCFRDALLHGGQLMVSQDLCLPVRIERIAIRDCASAESGASTCIAVLHGKTAEEVLSSVRAVDGRGRVTESVSGFAQKIVERHDEHPTAEDLADPGPRDGARFASSLARHANGLGLETPLARLRHVPGLARARRDERRRVAAAAVRELAASLTAEPIVLEWERSGRPRLGGAIAERLDVSIAHDGPTLLCALGSAPQGCDIETVTARPREAWSALLGPRGEALLEQLARSGDDLARAGTRAWAVTEAARKALQSPRIELSLEARNGEATRCAARAAGGACALLAFPLRLSRGREVLLALVAPARAAGR